MVDWSAATTPRTGKDSIWWALLRRKDGKGRLTRRENPSTRHASTQRLADVLANITKDGDRVLIGFDFPFGYPTGTAERLSMTGLPWKQTWQAIANDLDDAPDNLNNRIDVAERLNERLSGEPFPFWGNVREEERPYLVRRGRRPHRANDLTEWRLCDERAKTTSSVWQLAGAGSVGSQALTGIPRLLQLRTDPRLAMISHIWPFETGLRHDPRSQIILAEIYPSLVEPTPERNPVKDARQVRTIAAHFAALDEAGNLGALFEGDPAMTAAERTIVETEESWILGA